MRSCTGAIVSLASVVMMVVDRTTTCSPATWPRHSAHRPANANGSSSFRWMKYGCLRF